MIKLIKPSIEHKEMYKSMIEEWQQFGGPYAPCIVDYDCSNPIDELDYDATIKVVDDYSKGNIFDYDTSTGLEVEKVAKAIEFIINCDDDVIIPEFGIKDIENY